MTYIREAETAKPLQHKASRQRHKSGQVDSPIAPALKQQQFMYPSTDDAEMIRKRERAKKNKTKQNKKKKNATYGNSYTCSYHTEELYGEVRPYRNKIINEKQRIGQQVT